MLNWIKKLRAYFVFRKKVFENSRMLFQKHGLLVDNLGRLYKVIELTQDELSYGAETRYIESKVSNELKSYNKTFIDLGIFDLVELNIVPLTNFTEQQIKEAGIDVADPTNPNLYYPSSYALIISFRLLNIRQLAINFIIFMSILIISLLIISILTLI